MDTMVEKEATQELKPASERNIILFFYAREEKQVWEELLPHLNLLASRYSGLLWKAYEYPLAIGDYTEQARQTFSADLDRLLLLIPCTNATLLQALWRSSQKDPRISAALARASIAPIALRAAAGVRGVISKPLTAYPFGPERDQACVELSLALEKRLRKLLWKQRQAFPQATTILAETARLRFLA